MLPSLKKIIYRFSTRLIRWHLQSHWKMTIGVGSRIARSAKLDKTNPKGIHIGEYTAVAFDAAILTHDFVNGTWADVHVGDNCLIGARSIILPGVRVGNNCVVGAGSVVMVDVPDNCVVTGNPARIVERNIITGHWGIRNVKFLRQLGIESGDTLTKSQAAASPTPQYGRQEDNSVKLEDYVPDLEDENKTFDQLGIDSFSLITLRAEIEEGEGKQISDAEWSRIEKPADLRRFITRRKIQSNVTVKSATLRKHYDIGMPQMSYGGLSEAWLFKEIGDIHWTILTSSLGVQSSSIVDQSGDRLYATFTRVRYRSTTSLANFKENDTLDVTAATSRFGAGMFFSSIQCKTIKDVIDFELMTSFAKFGETGNNKSLMKGQPIIPDDFAIPSLNEIPDFAKQYRENRSKSFDNSIFSTDYEIVPIHDINGVNLLYFASYPIISEICTSRYFSKSVASSLSTIERDICYFANSGSDEAISFTIHADFPSGENRIIDSSLTRPDGTRMAVIRTVYGPRVG